MFIPRFQFGHGNLVKSHGKVLEIYWSKCVRTLLGLFWHVWLHKERGRLGGIETSDSWGESPWKTTQKKAQRHRLQIYIWIWRRTTYKQIRCCCYVVLLLDEEARVHETEGTGHISTYVCGPGLHLEWDVGTLWLEGVYLAADVALVSYQMSSRQIKNTDIRWEETFMFYVFIAWTCSRVCVCVYIYTTVQKFGVT